MMHSRSLKMHALFTQGGHWKRYFPFQNCIKAQLISPNVTPSVLTAPDPH